MILILSIHSLLEKLTTKFQKHRKFWLKIQILLKMGKTKKMNLPVLKRESKLINHNKEAIDIISTTFTDLTQSRKTTDINTSICPETVNHFNSPSLNRSFVFNIPQNPSTNNINSNSSFVKKILNVENLQHSVLRDIS